MTSRALAHLAGLTVVATLLMVAGLLAAHRIVGFLVLLSVALVGWTLWWTGVHWWCSSSGCRAGSRWCTRPRYGPRPARLGPQRWDDHAERYGLPIDEAWLRDGGPR